MTQQDGGAGAEIITAEEGSLAEIPGSMAYKLAHAGDPPVVKSEEELAQEAAQREAEAQAQQEAAAAAAQQEADAGKTQEELDAEAARAAEAAKAEASPEPPEPKFTTVEEYQKALKAAETRMHQATTETATERKAREAAESRAEAAEREAAELKAAQDAAAAEAAAIAAKPKLKEKYAAVLKKIQAIPMVKDEETGEMTYPPDYDDKVAEAWAETGIDPEQVAKEAAKIAREELRREQAAERAAERAETEEQSRARIREDAEKLAGAEGLDMTPGSADYRLFYTYVDELANNPEHEFREKSFEDQVKWAAGGVKQLLHKKIAMTDAEREAARRHQENNAVLERGITNRSTPEPPKQRSMAQILGQA